MNYEKVANSIAHAFATDDAGTFDLAGSIADALRAAANEAAYRGFDIGAQLDQGESWDDCDDEMTSEFGPRPKEARDE